MPAHPDDLNELERRLAAWAPATAGVDADVMLSAAGRASVRAGRLRFVWPALSASLTALVVVLGVWLANERDQRLALVQQVHPLAPIPPYVPMPAEPVAENEQSPLGL